MDMDKVVRRHGIRFWVLVSASPSPARHDQGRHSAPRLRQPSTPGGLALDLLLLAVGALVATGRLHAPAQGSGPGHWRAAGYLLALGLALGSGELLASRPLTSGARGARTPDPLLAKIAGLAA